MAPTIRKADISDIPILTALIRDSFLDVAELFQLTPENAPSHPSNCRPEWIESAMEKGAEYFLLENDNLPCGCVAMERAGDDYCYLERLSVLPEYRRRGYGKLLVEHVLAEARATGLARVEIAIITEHTDLQRWYESLGFGITGGKTFEHLPFGVTFLATDLS